MTSRNPRPQRRRRAPIRFIEEEFPEERELRDDEWASDVDSDLEYDLLIRERRNHADDSDNSFITGDDPRPEDDQSDDAGGELDEEEIRDKELCLTDEEKLENEEEDLILEMMASENEKLDRLAKSG